MSVFKEAEAPTTETTSSQQTSFLEQLVATKGEQFRDPEAIAKKAVHADKLIEEQKAELARLKAYEELIEGLKKDPKAGLAQIIKPKEEPEPKPEIQEKTTQESGDIESQLELLLEKREQKTKAKSNLQVVEDKLQETFGEKAPEVVRNRAQELGMSVEKLAGMAAESPAAFFRLIGVQEETRTKTFVPTQVNTTSTAQKFRNSQYYEQELAKNPKLIHDLSFTQQMYNDMLERKKTGNWN